MQSRTTVVSFDSSRFNLQMADGAGSPLVMDHEQPHAANIRPDAKHTKSLALFLANDLWWAIVTPLVVVNSSFFFFPLMWWTRTKKAKSLEGDTVQRVTDVQWACFIAGRDYYSIATLLCYHPGRRVRGGMYQVAPGPNWILLRSIIE